MMEGGIQVNVLGERFSNEHRGYSEQALDVLRQPDGIAWNVYDLRLHDLGKEFEDYRAAMEAGAVRTAESAEDLAEIADLPVEALCHTLKQIRRHQAGLEPDPFGRNFTCKPPLTPPYYAVRVTGALFHTQGGLEVNEEARVKRAGGGLLPNLFAGGGAACGVSGPELSGYLSGNGLLTAVTLGRIAGENAAALTRSLKPVTGGSGPVQPPTERLDLALRKDADAVVQKQGQ